MTSTCDHNNKDLLLKNIEWKSTLYLLYKTLTQTIKRAGFAELNIAMLLLTVQIPCSWW